LAFFIFEDLAFFETANGQIWPFYAFGPGNRDNELKLDYSFFNIVGRLKSKFLPKKSEATLKWHNFA